MLYRIYIDHKGIIETFDNTHTTRLHVRINNVQVFRDGAQCGNFNITDGGAYALSTTNVFEHVSHAIDVNKKTKVVTARIDIDDMEVL